MNKRYAKIETHLNVFFITKFLLNDYIYGQALTVSHVPLSHLQTYPILYKIPYVL